MILRLVKLTVRAEYVSDFERLFGDVESQIKAWPGCISVKLLRDSQKKNVFFTVSEWDTTENLDYYRQSAFFSNTWKKVKTLFEEKAQAWSLVSA